jgi:hypothetical protein
MDRLVRPEISFVKLFFRPHEGRDSSTVFLVRLLAPDGVASFGGVFAWFALDERDQRERPDRAT